MHNALVPLPRTVLILGGILLASFSAVVLYRFRAYLDAGTISCAFLLGVTVAAIFFGRVSALVCAITSALLLNYFFIEPRFTLSIAKQQDLLTFVIFLCSALMVGQLSSIARQRALVAEQQREELRASNLALSDALKQAEETEDLRRSEQVKSALLDAVTHDLRTPLTSIKASATTLLSSPELEVEGQRELLAVIDEESDRLNRFIESMIRLARLQSGTALENPGTCSAADVIEAALQRLPYGHGHPVEVENRDGTMLRCDPALISEVLYILLDNAVKHTPADTPIKLTTAVQDSATVLDVRDWGPGIAATDRAHVFEKFYRAPGKQQGLGMGLAIARNITEAHGGTLSLVPVNEGTLFRVSLPQRAVA